jgi:hypothetical protein
MQNGERIVTMKGFLFWSLPHPDMQPNTLRKFLFFVTTFLIVLVCSGCILSNVDEKEGVTSPVEVKTSVFREATLTATSEREDKSHQVKILHQGETTLRTTTNEIDPSTYFDLDSEKQGTGDPIKGDIAFQSSAGSMVFYFLMPVNSAISYYQMGASASYEDCFQALSSFTKGSIPEFNDGKPICLLTNENHLAMVKYIANSIHRAQNGEATVSISYIVWDPIIDRK